MKVFYENIYKNVYEGIYESIAIKDYEWASTPSTAELKQKLTNQLKLILYVTRQ